LRKEFAGTLKSSFALMGGVHLSLNMPADWLIGEANAFLEKCRDRPVIVSIETPEEA
jgi:hypothetical protein